MLLRPPFLGARLHDPGNRESYVPLWCLKVSGLLTEFCFLWAVADNDQFGGSVHTDQKRQSEYRPPSNVRVAPRKEIWASIPQF